MGSAIKVSAETCAVWDALESDMRRVRPITVGATTTTAISNADDVLKRVAQNISLMRLALRKEQAAQRARIREDRTRRVTWASTST